QAGQELHLAEELRPRQPAGRVAVDVRERHGGPGPALQPPRRLPAEQRPAGQQREAARHQRRLSRQPRSHGPARAPQTLIPRSRAPLTRSRTRRATRPISGSTSRLLARGWTTTELGSRSLPSAPPTRVRASPACSIIAEALRPGGSLNIRPAASK